MCSLIKRQHVFRAVTRKQACRPFIPRLDAAQQPRLADDDLVFRANPLALVLGLEHSRAEPFKKLRLSVAQM